jgi:hypothetical protein
VADDVDGNESSLDASPRAVELLGRIPSPSKAVIQEHHQRGEDAEEDAKTQDDAISGALPNTAVAFRRQYSQYFEDPKLACLSGLF